MIKLVINILIFFILTSCQIKNTSIISESVAQKKELVKKLISNNKNNIFENSKNKDVLIKYVVGDPFYVEGVKYIPQENFKYNKIGLANYYGKELHNKITLNNDLNKVTELYARHNTLPLPSIVKITNLDNGLFITVKINDRQMSNSSLIQVSRKSAQLLKFYKNKIAKVRVEILSDPSKQMKIVTQSRSKPAFNKTISSAPTESVSISNIVKNSNIEKENKPIDDPIEIGFENVSNIKLFLKVYNFSSYNELKNIIKELNIDKNFSTKNEGTDYSVVIGPLDNLEANNLVLSFISKGYKKTEFILE